MPSLKLSNKSTNKLVNSVKIVINERSRRKKARRRRRTTTAQPRQQQPTVVVNTGTTAISPWDRGVSQQLSAAEANLAKQQQNELAKNAKAPAPDAPAPPRSTGGLLSGILRRPPATPAPPTPAPPATLPACTPSTTLRIPTINSLFSMLGRTPRTPATLAPPPSPDTPSIDLTTPQVMKRLTFNEDVPPTGSPGQASPPRNAGRPTFNWNSPLNLSPINSPGEYDQLQWPSTPRNRRTPEAASNLVGSEPPGPRPPTLLTDPDSPQTPPLYLDPPLAHEPAREQVLRYLTTNLDELNETQGWGGRGEPYTEADLLGFTDRHLNRLYKRLRSSRRESFYAGK